MLVLEGWIHSGWLHSSKQRWILDFICQISELRINGNLEFNFTFKFLRSIDNEAVKSLISAITFRIQLYMVESTRILYMFCNIRFTVNYFCLKCGR